MNDEQRAALGALVAAARRQRYGTKSAAYQAASVNATTWSHIEDGVPVREDRLMAAVRTLWPSSGGDWRKVRTDAPADRPLIAYTNRVLLDELEARLTEREREGRGQRPAAIAAETVPDDAMSDLTAEELGRQLRTEASQQPPPESADPGPL